jgi:hypothetical protein
MGINSSPFERRYPVRIGTDRYGAEGCVRRRRIDQCNFHFKSRSSAPPPLPCGRFFSTKLGRPVAVGFPVKYIRVAGVDGVGVNICTCRGFETELFPSKTLQTAIMR